MTKRRARLLAGALLGMLAVGATAACTGERPAASAKADGGSGGAKATGGATATGGAGAATGSGGATQPLDEATLTFEGSITFVREQP